MSNIIKEGFEKNHKSFNGRYIVFLPRNHNKQLTTEEYMLQEIEKVKGYFEEIDSNPEVGYLLSSRKSKEENAIAISKFENDSNHLKLIFAIDMLNEGVHIDGIDGVIMLRPLSAGNKILYYQQIGRCIYALDPNRELEQSELPVIFDVYNNYLEQNIHRQVNRHTITSDLYKLHLIKEWINKHFRYPDINSESISEARKAITLKSIQKKYFKYLNNSSYNSNLNETEIHEIKEIVKLGISIDLWNIEIPKRTIDPTEHDIQQFATFELKGEQKEFIDLFKNASKIVTDNSLKSKKLKLMEILNILDIMSEYDIEINNKNVPMECVLKNIYSDISINILNLIKEEITVDDDYELGKEYNEAKKQFYKKNPIFLDYDINTLRKMGIFSSCKVYDGFNNIEIVDSKGFIIKGPDKFLKLNIYTGTYFSPEGLNIDGLDEQNFSKTDGFINKYNFGRDGYYYEVTEDGEYIKTDSIYNPYGYNIKGDYHELQLDGSYKNFGKINPYGFDIDGYYYKYNKIIEKYIKTNSIFDDRGFDRDGIFWDTWRRNVSKTKIVEYADGIERVFENVTFFSEDGRINAHSKFSTDLPYDLNYFDREGYYYTLDDHGNRIKSNLKYNDRYLDVEGYYYELQPDGTRKKTSRIYDDNYFDLKGYYYELQPDGTRKKTKNKTNSNKINCFGLNIKYNIVGSRHMAFDKDGFCYECVRGMFIKVEPPTKISKYGFDVDGYYHELLPDGTRNEIPTQSKLDPFGFDECGSIRVNGKLSRYDSHDFDQAGIHRHTKKNKDKHGFYRDGMFDYVLPSGKTKKLPFNNKFFTIDGFYYKKYKREDGSSYIKKIKRKTDDRGFDIDGIHYDVQINKLKNEYEYLNPMPYDNHYFDADGIYYELPKITSINGSSRYVSYDRVKTRPPKYTDEYGFNFNGFYCVMVDGELKVTDSKYTPYGFDRDGYYKELTANGEKTRVDKHGFDRDGLYNGSYKDNYGFTQKDYFEYENGIAPKRPIINSFDIEGNYHDSEGKNIGPINLNGFDRDGYYHELLSDGTRNLKHSGSKLDPRFFAADCTYHGPLTEVAKVLYSRYEDSRGFNINRFFWNTGRPYDSRYFDVDGYYWELTDETRRKTNRKYDDKYFDREGYYYELLPDGTRQKTNKKFNDNGIDCHGFNEKGIHSITKLKYDENYFRADGINIITGTMYSLFGYSIDGTRGKESSILTTYMYNSDDQELECVYIAKMVLSLPLDKRELVFEYIPGDSRNQKELNQKLYKYIIAASIIDPNVKQMLVDYIIKLSIEIKKISEELKKEKSKKEQDIEIIKTYEKKLAYYREMKKNTEMGA